MIENLFNKIINSKLSTYTLLKFIFKSFFGREEIIIEGKFSVIIHLLSIIYVATITSLVDALLITVLVNIIHSIIKACLKQKEKNKFDRIIIYCYAYIIILITVTLLIILMIYVFYYFYTYLIKWSINKLYSFFVDTYNNILLPTWNILSNFYVKYTKDTILIIVSIFNK